MKYNDTYDVVSDSEANREAVKQRSNSVAREFGFHTNSTAKLVGNLGFDYELQAGGRRYYVSASICELHHGLADEDLLTLSPWPPN